MTTKKVCGIDVHRDSLIATILDPETNQKHSIRYQNSLNNIQQLIIELKQHNCQKTVMESTGIYYKPLYTALETANLEPILANAYQVKAIPGRKTDQNDSEWLAQLLHANLIKPSYIPPKQTRELRDLTRLRTKYVQARTQNKNRVQKILNSVNIRIHTVLSDPFGKAGTELLEGLIAGKTVEQILKETRNKRLKAKSEEIQATIQGTLSTIDIFMLKQTLKTIDNLNEQIGQIEQRIMALMDKDTVKILCSVPGVGLLSAAIIIAELGDPKRFSNGKAVACWTGLVPSLHQSAGTTILGHITKRGSCHLRWCMIEVAHAAIKSSRRFKGMFLRICARKGCKVAYVAVARKLLTVVWHLLVNGELYVEEGFVKRGVRVQVDGVFRVVLFEDVFKVLRDAMLAVSAVDDG